MIWIITRVFSAIYFDYVRIWVKTLLDFTDNLHTWNLFPNPHIVGLITAIWPVTITFDFSHALLLF